MPNKVLTNISEAYWCRPNGSFEPALHGGHAISWLDKLLEGGLVLPEPETIREPRALSVLISGPPGSGKSTLALEMCYRWAVTPQRMLKDITFNSLYITAETNKQWPQQKANDLNWQEREVIIYHDENKPETKRDKGNVRITNTHKFVDYLMAKASFKSRVFPTKATHDALKKATNIDVPEELIAELVQNIKVPPELGATNLFDEVGKFNIDVLVVDSLNTIGPVQAQNELMTRFHALTSSGLRIILIILEADDPSTKQWLYSSDLVIKMGLHFDGDYLIRDIEILKARYQPHVWGRHQLKFIGGLSGKSTQSLTTKGSRPKSGEIAASKREHPYRSEGGIFIYPSIPYHLSLYKRSSPDLPLERFSTGIEELNIALRGDSQSPGGFPKGRCTGLLGMRGGHKSHLGYLCLLNHVLEAKRSKATKRKALIISLRDDENMARKALVNILHEIHHEEAFENRKKLDSLEKEGKLEIQFFPPGHITPEEFYHRILMTILRMKRDGAEVALLFNSLDQLGSRFPLCAQERIFIPGIIETLTAENVTSIFIGVDEKGQPGEQYGMLSMADALISFDRWRLHKNDYIGHLMEKAIKQARNEKTKLQFPKVEDIITKIEKDIPTYPQPVILNIVRFAGGQAAKIGGFLELIDKSQNDPEIRKTAYGCDKGLAFVPFSPAFRRRAAVSNETQSISIEEVLRHFSNLTTSATSRDKAKRR